MEAMACQRNRRPYVRESTRVVGFDGAGAAGAACQTEAKGAPGSASDRSPSDTASAPKPGVYVGRPSDGRFASPAAQMHAYLKNLKHG